MVYSFPLALLLLKHIPPGPGVQEASPEGSS